MSLTTDRPTDTLTDLTNTEKTFLTAWGDEQGLEVVIMPSKAGSTPMAFVGYSDGIPSWSIYRADGRLWLCDIDHQAGRKCEGAKRAVECIEHAADRIQADADV